MYFSKKQIFAVLSFTGFAAASPYNSQNVKTDYTGTKVFRLVLSEDKDITTARNIVTSLGLDTWKASYRVNTNVDVVVPKKLLASFNKKLEGTGLTRSIMHEDLQASIDEESATMHISDLSTAAAPSATWFTAYHSYADHLTFLNQLVAAYPSNTEIVTSGSSTQGRTITGIHIWGKTKGKPAAVIHGTVHAREWITTMVTEYFAYNLLLDNSTYLNNVDFYIFPVVNPDGFVYTQTNTRLWRKNRLTISSSSCVGTDINRNWNYKWSTTGGASTDPCAEDYKGTSAASTVENKALTAYLQNLKSTVGLKLFIDYHSYSQLIMSPWGYTCSAQTPDYAEHQALLKSWAAASKTRYGTSWTYGPICTTIYQATGSSVDFNYGSLGNKYSFTVELRDTGNYGFVLPASQITPSGAEAYDGLKNLLANLKY